MAGAAFLSGRAGSLRLLEVFYENLPASEKEWGGESSDLTRRARSSMVPRTPQLPTFRKEAHLDLRRRSKPFRNLHLERLDASQKILAK
jgi:hypothetical protein